MRHKLIPLSILLYFASALSLKAQWYTAHQLSSWSGITSVTLNPAIANNKMKLDIGLGGFNAAFNNNLLGIGGTKVFKNRKMWGEFMNPDLTQDALLLDDGAFKLDGKPKRITKSNQVEMPLSFLISFGRKNENAIAFTYHVNSIKNFDNVNESAARLFLGRYDSSAATLWGQSESLSGFTAKAMAWADYGITYSRVVHDKGDHFVKVGATLKYLQGLGAFYLNAEDVTVNWTNNQQAELEGNFNYAHSQDFLVTDKNKFNFKHIGLPSVGADAGFVYEWRPKRAQYRYNMNGDTSTYHPEKDIYTLAFGFAIVDMGAIKYRRDAATYNFTATGTYNPQIFNAIPNGVYTLNDSINKYFARTSGGNTFTMYLPTRFNIYLDYNIGKGFHLNAASVVSVDMTRQKNQLHYVTSFSLIPRWDITWFGVALPLTADMNKNFGVGVALRAGPVYFGTQNVISLGLKKAYNLNLYAGVRVTIPNLKHKDTDGDGVSDSYDKCKNLTGNWQTRGCPDADRDGVRDEQDSCVNEPGPAKTNGCPDRDGDGVIDKYDRCPDLVAINSTGCPDTDGDGILDPDDRCPDMPGDSILKGCPDSDMDGVPDIDDKCLKVKGDKDHFGCPDTDGDRIYDYEDDDPYQAGPAENNGAPWGDSDGDGIKDNEDRCKFEAGPKALGGCPSIKTLAQKANSTLYDNLLFEKGEFELKTKHKQVLDQLIKTMNLPENINASVNLIGYTDNTERSSAEELDLLSEKRVKGAKTYLLTRGFNTDRLAIEWAGSDTPVGDNNTESGRTKNRRVAIKVVQILNDDK